MKIGVDWGGTKIEAIAIDPNSGSETNRLRVDSPKDNYEEIIDKVVWLINEITKGINSFTVGIGMPGSIHPETNLVQVSNTKALENKPVKMDIENQLGYDIKIANDADCLALSEAIDGAGSEHNSVFAVILGTASNGFAKGAQGFTLILPSIVTAITIVGCMFALSIVMKTIPVGVTYASFAGLCIVATTIVGIYKFNQMPDLYTIVGLCFIIIGVLMVNLLGSSN